MSHEKYSKLELITPKMLYNTVMCDERTCLWFRKLITRPLAIDRIKQTVDGQRIFGRYKAHSFTAAALAVLSLILFLAALLFFQHFFVPVSLAAGLAAAGCILFLSSARRDLAAISVHLMTLDRAMIPSGTTLFQLGEIYSRKYEAPSLVTIIWVWDQWFRNSLIALCCITFGVLFLPLWGQILGILVGCCLTACLIKISVMARRDFNEKPSFDRIVNKLHDHDNE